VGEVIDEIRALPGRWLFFVDDNLFAEPDAGMELCRALEGLSRKWACQLTLDVAGRPEQLRALEKAGCACVIVGFESLNPESLDQMRKRWNRSFGGFDELAGLFRGHHMMVWGSFVFGYDGDTPDIFRRTVEFAVRNKFVLANFNALTPTPATPLYDRLKEEGRLINEPWWLHDDFRFGDAMFTPAGMTPDGLRDGCYHARTRFNRLSSIATRFLDPGANLRTPGRAGLFLAANAAARREVHRKHGLALG